MKAIILNKAGGVENLQLKEIDKPRINQNDVLIQTKAISINPVDYKVRSENQGLNMMYGEDRPVILGWDLAGIVVEVGNKVTNFKKGDRVFGMVNFPGNGAAYAEYVASPESHIAKIHENISFSEASATTLAALTALQILKGRVNKGDKVLIHGGSGGVGHFAIQIAKNMGAYVYTTASAKNRDFVLGLGADEHIDYRSQKFEEIVSGLDFVLDIFGGDILKNSLTVLKEGGKVFSTTLIQVPDELAEKAKKVNVTVDGLLVKSSADDMKTLSEMLNNGAIKPNIHKSFDFKKMSEAHATAEQGNIVGKIIVTL